jgi:hypothetical protein
MMKKLSKTILIAPILLLSILLIAPATAQASSPFNTNLLATEFTTLQILGTFSGGDQPGPDITSVFVNDNVPVDPKSPMWQDPPQRTVSLNGQNITIPILFNPTVTSLNVRSMNNGTWIGFWLEWADPTKSDAALSTNQFRDSIGVALPVTSARTFIAMGGPETPVNVLHWKADWQTDIDIGHYQDRQDAYPNMAYDLYLGKNEEKGEVLNYDPTTQDFKEQGAGDPRIHVSDLNIDYQPGMKAGAFTGNYWLSKVSPVEELVAEGFGTLTTQKVQNSFGKGVYENGKWNVVIMRPMLTGDMTDKQFKPGEKTNVAFAIWDGGNREVNGRKAVALWHDLIVEAGAASALVEKEPLVVPPAAEGASMTVAAAGIIAAAIVAGAIIFYYARRKSPSITR